MPILTPFIYENIPFVKDIGFEPIQWKYECQGLHLSESNNYQAAKWVLFGDDLAA